MKTRRTSSMIVYERLSPNRTSPRKKPIKRLTPHCMAGNLTIEACLGLSRFVTPSSPGVSCTYAIGSDGRIGLNVIESDAPWTSSSSVNDNQAITFEIANCGGAPDWSMTEKAVASFLKLAIDICKFYGYKKVHYETKPASVKTKDEVEAWIKTWEKPDEMIITLHRWFKNKACPGDYFVRLLPGLVKDINKALGTETEPEPPTILPPVGSYLIRITAKTLNIRKGPGTNFPVVGIFKNDPHMYTIVEESLGTGAKKWGKLKSGAGWIALDFTEKVGTVSKPEEPIFKSYVIKITAKTLNIRQGPGTNYPVVKTFKNDPHRYTIVEEATGIGAKKWGKLKSGIGWIALDYTEKV